MIQRIQTVYLFLVIVFSFVALLSHVGEWTVMGETVAECSNFTFAAYGPYASYSSYGPFSLGILLILVMMLSLLSIMLFRKRMRQLRLTIVSTILLVGYCVTYAIFMYKFNMALEAFAPDENLSFHIPFAAIFPFLSIILNILAIVGIRKDEALVRSLDRLR